MVEVILLERIERLGQMGDIVKVRPGYARNFLLPFKKAMRATESNRQIFEKQKSRLEAENLRRREDAEAAALRLVGLAVPMARQAGENGHLYGSVTARDITDTLADQEIALSRNQIVIDRPIKTVGVHDVRIVLHPEVSISVKIGVAATGEEAKTLLAKVVAAAAPPPVEDPETTIPAPTVE